MFWNAVSPSYPDAIATHPVHALSEKFKMIYGLVWRPVKETVHQLLFSDTPVHRLTLGKTSASTSLSAPYLSDGENSMVYITIPPAIKKPHTVSNLRIK